MDLAAFTTAITLFKEALSMVKKVKDFLPDSPQKEEAEKTLAKADESFKIAETQAAQELGYTLCQCTWPPQIMLSIGYDDDVEEFQCPKCNKISPPSISDEDENLPINDDWATYK